MTSVATTFRMITGYNKDYNVGILRRYIWLKYINHRMCGCNKKGKTLLQKWQFDVSLTSTKRGHTRDSMTPGHSKHRMACGHSKHSNLYVNAAPFKFRTASWLKAPAAPERDVAETYNLTENLCSRMKYVQTAIFRSWTCGTRCGVRSGGSGGGEGL